MGQVGRISDRKPVTKVLYTSSVRMMSSGRFVFTRLTSLPVTSGLTATDGGLLGLMRKKALTSGSSSLANSVSLN